MAKVAKKKKKNYRLRKSVRRTLGALFMMSAIIVAAIPFPDAAATNGDVSTSLLNNSGTSYIYDEVETSDELEDCDDYDATEMIDLSGKLAIEDEKGNTNKKALIIRQNSNGSYVLYKQLDFFEQDFTNGSVSGVFGVVSKYNSVYQAGTIKLPSSVYKDYYTVDPDEFTDFFTTPGDLDDLTVGGDINITLDLSNGDLVNLFKEFQLSEYTEYVEAVKKYNDYVSNPIGPVVEEPTPISFNPRFMSDKERYYCYIQKDLAGCGYTLEYVNDKSSDSATSDDVFIYIARGGTPPAKMQNDDLGFLVKNTASIIAVGDETFKDVRNVDFLTLPSEIKYIGKSAFQGSFIKEVTLEGTEFVGHFAFKNCTQLRKVVLGPASNIGIEAFHGCLALDTIDFPYQVSKIGYGAFANCTKLSNVDLSKAKTSGLTVGDGAFYNCALGNLNLGETGIETLGDGVFATTAHEIDQLTEVNMQASKITTFGESVFFGRNKLLKVIMPAVFGVNSKDKLPSTTFQGCSGLGMVEFPQVSGRVTYDSDIFSSVKNEEFVVQ